MLVVIDPPVLGQYPGLLEGAEQFLIEELVTEPAVERLDVGVLPGRARLDIRGTGTTEPAKVPDRVGSQLRAVVHPDEGWGAATDLDQLFEDINGPFSCKGPVYLDYEYLPGELINHVQEPELPAVMETVR